MISVDTATPHTAKRAIVPTRVRRAAGRPIAWGALILLGPIIVAGAFAPWVATHSPFDSDLSAVLLDPSSAHLLGTDELGRDIFSRVVWGARTSLVGGLFAVTVASCVGVPAGLAAAYVGGRVDVVLTRIVDVLMSIPGMILAVTVIAIFGSGLMNAMTAVGIVLIPTFFRVTRASAMEIREETFVAASVSIGCSDLRVALVHVLPNAAPPVVLQATLSLAIAVIAEAGLSFVGLGARQPSSSWGAMLSDATQRPDVAMLLYVPAVAMLATIAGLTLVGDLLREADRVGGQS